MHPYKENICLYDYIGSEMINRFWSKYKFNGIVNHQHGTQFSAEFKNLIESTLMYDSNKRLSLSEIKNHPWTNLNEIKIHTQIQTDKKAHILDFFGRKK